MNSATVRGIIVLIVCAHECVILGCSVGFGSAPGSDTPPHFSCSLSPAAKCLTFAEGNALVRVSATMLSVGQYIRQREPFLMT